MADFLTQSRYAYYTSNMRTTLTAVLVYHLNDNVKEVIKD